MTFDLFCQVVWSDDDFIVIADYTPQWPQYTVYERYEIIDKLSKFFDGVSIIDEQCRIESITFVFTEERPSRR